MSAQRVRRVRELRAALATPTVMTRADERISGLGSSRNGPFGPRILKLFSRTDPGFTAQILALPNSGAAGEGMKMLLPDIVFHSA
jgi:hypothetical protein